MSGTGAVTNCDRIDALEARYDEQFASVFEAIKLLITEDKQRKGKRSIGVL